MGIVTFMPLPEFSERSNMNWSERILVAVTGACWAGIMFGPWWLIPYCLIGAIAGSLRIAWVVSHPK